VARGEAEIGMQQINVILPVVGADYVGPFPAGLQGYVYFAVGVLAVSKKPDAAQALVKFMSSPPMARTSVPTYLLIIAASLQLDFADLSGGLGVGVVRDIGKDRLRMRGKGGLKSVRRVEIEMPHRDIGRRHPGAGISDRDIE
jgi:hypothetical protein